MPAGDKLPFEEPTLPGQTTFAAWKALLVVAALLAAAGEALAYAGPAPGPEFFGYAMSLFAWAAAAVGGVLLYPFYALMRRLRGGKDKAEPTPEARPENEASPALSSAEGAPAPSVRAAEGVQAPAE
jgi:hypothetical protein